MLQQQHRARLRVAAAAWVAATGMESGSGGITSMGAAADTVSSNASNRLGVVVVLPRANTASTLLFQTSRCNMYLHHALILSVDVAAARR